MSLIPLPASIEATVGLLAKADYIADRSLATVLYLALKMGRPIFLEGRGRRRQDRDRQGSGQEPRPQADPLAVLRGARRRRRRLRVELRRADDRYPSRRGRRRARPRPHRARHLLRALPDQAAALAGAGAGSGRRAGAADRRDRPYRRSLRGVSSGSACRLPGHGAGARHGQGAAAADRRRHLQSHARGARRARSADVSITGSAIPTQRAN